MLPADFGIVVGMEGSRVAVAVSGQLDSQAAAIGLRVLTQALKRCRSEGGDMVLRFAAT